MQAFSSSNGALIKKDFFILLNSAIKAIDPVDLIKKNVKFETVESKDYLSIARSLDFSNEKHDNDGDRKLLLNKNVYVLAFGKAALGMSSAIENLIGHKHIVKGVAILPYNDARKFLSTSKNMNQIEPFQNSKIEYFYGAQNNLPDKNSCTASLRAYEMCKNLKDSDLLLTLISGGGSALLSLPADICQTGHSVHSKNLQLKLETIKELVNAGASINELNTVRSVLSEVKAGKLAKLAYPSRIISLVISDVIDDSLEIIASGPTFVSLLSANGNQRALDVIHKYCLSAKLPSEIMRFLSTDSEKNNDQCQEYYQINNHLIGSNRMATQAVLDEISSRNLPYNFKHVLSNRVAGEAKIVGSIFACLAFGILNQNTKLDLVSCSSERVVEDFKRFIKTSLNSLESSIFPVEDISKQLQLLNEFLDELLNKHDFKEVFINRGKICLITGGETTVSGGEIGLMSSASSKGGRCQEMTLAFEYMFTKLSGTKSTKASELLFSSFGSDGIDGPTDAAGAFCLFDLKQNLTNNSSQMEEFLHRHDSYNYFSNQNRLIKIGSTGTNVSDIQILLIDF